MLRWRVLSLCVYHTVLLHPNQNSLLCSTVYNTLCTFVSRLRVLRFLVVVELPFFARYSFRSCAMSLRVVLSLLRLLASGLFWFSFSAACDRVILSAIPRLTMMLLGYFIHMANFPLRCLVSTSTRRFLPFYCTVWLIFRVFSFHLVTSRSCADTPGGRDASQTIR